MFNLLSTLVALCALTIIRATNAGSVKKAALKPIMGGVNFPDPAIIRTGDGWHLFSTNAVVDGKWINVQKAFTHDWINFEFQKGVDALPVLPKWADPAPRVWAPDVVRLDDGSFIMYYTVAYGARPNLHCSSFATAKNINDAFVDNSHKPWICPLQAGGAIDISGFTDEKNGHKRWVVYKIDGNAIGHGGECGNTVAPIVPTPIMLQQVAQDGHTLIGKPTRILTNIASDGPYIEAPSLTFMNGKYVILFSSQCYMGSKYDVQYAVADTITGPYKRSGRLLGTGDMGLSGPGGLDVTINGDHAIFHAYAVKTPGKLEKCKNFERRSDCRSRHSKKIRPAYAVTLSMKDGVMRVAAG